MQEKGNRNRKGKPLKLEVSMTSYILKRVFIRHIFSIKRSYVSESGVKSGYSNHCLTVLLALLLGLVQYKKMVKKLP